MQYCPSEAEVPIATVLIYVGNEEDKNFKILKISAIAKYPLLTIDHTRIEFGDLLVGTSKDLKYVFRNPAQVPVKFKIDKDSSDS